MISAVRAQDLGVEHDGVDRTLAAFVQKGDDPLADADHVCRHADAGVGMCHQRVQQILCGIAVLRGGIR